MAGKIKIVGEVPAALAHLIERAGYRLERFDSPLDTTATDLESLDPVVLSDLGRYTARGIVQGLKRDIQATQRFFLLDDGELDDGAAGYEPATSEQELWALTEFTLAVTRALARGEIVTTAIDFLRREVGAAAVAVHVWDVDAGFTLAGALGFEPDQLAALEVYFEGVDPTTADFQRGRFVANQGVATGVDLPLSAWVPLVAKDDVLGVLSVVIEPEHTLSMATLRAMGRQLALSLENGALLARAEAALGSLKRAQQQMSQAEKLAAVGLLAAGIAHEINNPASYIITNLTVLTDYVTDLLAYSRRVDQLLLQLDPDQAAQLAALRDEYDIDYLSGDTPHLIRRCLKGMRRIHEIVRDLKAFAHKGGGERDWVDINQVITQVLKLAGAELRHRARVELDLRPVPQVFIESTRLIQVLLNLIINAYQSFGERPRSENAVWVGSQSDGESIRIFVADNGCGISEEELDRIFEPFYTTKAVGTGTGLGLAISYELVRAMKGVITVDSTPGRGSRFVIELPLQQGDWASGLEWRESSAAE